MERKDIPRIHECPGVRRLGRQKAADVSVERLPGRSRSPEAANPHTFVLHSRQTREDPLEVDIRGDGYLKYWKTPFDPFPGNSPLASCSSGRSERTKHGPVIKPTRHAADIDIYVIT